MKTSAGRSGTTIVAAPPLAEWTFEDVFERPRAGMSDVTVWLSPVDGLPPPRGDQLIEYDDGLELRAERCGRYEIRGRDVTSHVDLGEGRVEVRVLDQAILRAEPEASIHLMMASSLIARRRGDFLLHSAALSGPDGDLLLVGPSDVGKSTLTHALVRAGWRAVSDDAVLVREAEAGGIEVETFRRWFGLDPDAIDRFPELRSHARPMLSEPEKCSVDIAAAYPGRVAERCRPVLTVYPAITGEAVSEVGPLPLPVAFVQLLSQSGSRALVDAQTEAHHRVLAALLAQAPPVSLRSGRDLLDAEVASQVLSEALEAHRVR